MMPVVSYCLPYHLMCTFCDDNFTCRILAHLEIIVRSLAFLCPCIHSMYQHTFSTPFHSLNTQPSVCCIHLPDIIPIRDSLKSPPSLPHFSSKSARLWVFPPISKYDLWSQRVDLQHCVIWWCQLFPTAYLTTWCVHRVITPSQPLHDPCKNIASHVSKRKPWTSWNNPHFQSPPTYACKC